MTAHNEFKTLDWVLFVTMLVISIGIGIFYAVKDALTNKSGDAAEFLMGGRKLKAVPGALSILVSFVSAITVLGTPAEMYTAGTLFILGVIGAVLSNLITALLSDVPAALSILVSFVSAMTVLGTPAEMYTARTLFVLGVIGAVPVALSILVSFVSAITVLGTPAEMYTAGTLFILGVIGVVFSNILTVLLFVPLLYPLQLTSSFEYLELRFQSRAAKLTGTLINVVANILYMGIATYAPSTALEAVTGFPTWASILITGCVSTIYTSLGGMKAVVWTDVFQSLVMVAGLLAIVIKGTMEVGGFDRVWETNEKWERIQFWTSETDPTVRHTVLGLIIGQTGFWLSAYGVNQPCVQRYCAVGSLKEAKCVVLFNILGVAMFLFTAAAAGIVMFAYYANLGCDPLMDGQVSNPNQLIPLFVMDVLGVPGLPGLLVSCLFSGALSTMSSCLNALSAVTWEDVLKPIIGDRISESAKTWIMRILVVLYGAAGVGFAFAAQQLGGTVLQASITFTGSAGGALLGVFFLGAVFPWANWIGCVVGGIVGLAFPLWISIGAYKLPRRGFALDFPTHNCSIAANTSVIMTTVSMTTTTVAPTVNEISGLDHLYTISYLYFAPIAILTAMIVGLIVSFLTGPMRLGETDPKYLIPVFDRLCCYIPEKARRKLRCGYEFREPKDIADEEKRHKMDVTSSESYMYEDGQHVIPVFSGSQDGSQKGIALVSLTKSGSKKY